MDIEQLKLILDAANAAGEGAWWIAVLWLGQAYFTSVLVAGVVSGVAIGAYKLIRRAIVNDSFCGRAAEALGRTWLNSETQAQAIAILRKSRENNSVSEDSTDVEG